MQDEKMKLSKTSIATLAIMATLAFSGISIPVTAASNSTVQVFSPAAPSFVGTAGGFLIGPNPVASQFSSTPTGGATTEQIPNVKGDLNPKPFVTDPKPTSTIPPSVNCPGAACFGITTNSQAATNPIGINAYENHLVNRFTVEPPDQGLCAGNGYVMESLNQGEVQVFSSWNLKAVSPVVSLDSLMGLTTLGWSSGGDIMCQFDSANGGHWIITQFVSANTEASGGPFAGCFVGAQDTCYEGIAVSTGSNPTGSYNVYFLNVNVVNNDPGSDANPDCSTGTCYAGVLLNDYAKTATTRDAFLLFYDEFDLVTNGLNGAQQFAFSKSGLEHGLPASSINVAYENMGTAANLSPIPTNGAYQPISLPGSAWYQVIPAQTTDPTQYDNANGGTGFMLASLDFFGAGDNRVAAFDWTGLSALNSHACNQCNQIQFGGALLTGVVTYQNEGGACPVADYLTVSTFCGLAAQKAGPTPLGDVCSSLGDGEPATCPEGGIATNGDGATNAFFSDGMLWTAVSTVVSQAFKGQSSEFHIGATYWGVGVSDSLRWNQNGNSQGVNQYGSSQSSPSFRISTQGIVSASHEDMEFPAMAASDGNVLMSFTLSGNGGPSGADKGGFYPSSAYLLLSDPGWSSRIHITALGQSPTDGFTEYQYYGTALAEFFRPRWGDYGQAVVDPLTHKFVFASEYIQSPNCSDSTFATDSTCGGTRAHFANWGSSINSLFAGF
jgi:hypothetical protein